MISLSPSHKEDCEISRTQGNSSCHQAALTEAEETQGVRKALSIIRALLRTQRGRKLASTLLKQIQVATAYRPLPSLNPQFPLCPFLGLPAQAHFPSSMQPALPSFYRAHAFNSVEQVMPSLQA